MTGPDGAVYEAVDTTDASTYPVCRICGVFETPLCSMKRGNKAPIACTEDARTDRRSIYWVRATPEPEPNPL